MKYKLKNIGTRTRTVYGKEIKPGKEIKIDKTKKEIDSLSSKIKTTKIKKKKSKKKDKKSKTKNKK